MNLIPNMNLDTLLLRQIHPSNIALGQIEWVAFRPTSKDNKKLSMYNGDLITAEASYIHFTQVLGLQSFGTTGVSCEECDNLNLSYVHDRINFDEHAHIDFDGLNRNAINNKAKELWALAISRGWIYPKHNNNYTDFSENEDLPF